MLRVALVGTGGISGAHLPAWKELEGAELVAVCDIRPEKVDAAAEQYGAKAYYDLDTMLDEVKPDILDICTPTYLHPEMALKGIRHGCNVLTEKPISLHEKDVDIIYAEAEKYGVRFMVAQVLRFWREYVYLKDVYDKKTYGRLLSGHMRRLGTTPRWSWDNWMTDPERSGMVPFDLHIHDLDFMVYAFGAPKKMECHRAGTPRQDYLHIDYDYDDFFISAEASWFSGDYRFCAEFVFQFEKAVVALEDGVLTVYPEDGKPFTLDGEDAPECGINLPATNAYAEEIRYFADCVANNKPVSIIKPEELKTVLRLIDGFSK